LVLVEMEQSKATVSPVMRVVLVLTIHPAVVVAVVVLVLLLILMVITVVLVVAQEALQRLGMAEQRYRR
jgi:hypothetical protein